MEEKSKPEQKDVVIIRPGKNQNQDNFEVNGFHDIFPNYSLIIIWEDNDSIKTSFEILRVK